ncbi:MAG: hypothetical protein KIT84_43210 [Labilithrix sp.]|nr:hypothetical protein [Labilithrix sp.]MCW5817888.1 hypothetical protein [Labilithrix sp.]
MPFWRCKNGHVTSGTLLRPPSKCSSCTETDLDVRAWHMKDCVCLECGKSYSPVTGVFEQPEWLKEALERIAEATIRKRG